MPTATETALASPTTMLPTALPTPTTLPPDQQQMTVDEASHGGLGGNVSQRLAQSFTISRNGFLTHLGLPMSCQPSAQVTIRIEDAPGGRPNGVVLAMEVVSGRMFISPVPQGGAGLHYNLVVFRPSPAVGQGIFYAFTLETEDGDCDVWWGPPGDPYPGGVAYFQETGNPPGWLELFAPQRDLAFQIFVADHVMDE
jgi:hypothetical protein